MPFAERRLTNPTTLSTVASTVYTVPSQYTTIVKQVVVTNTTASPASFNLYIGSATSANAIFSNTTISANDSLIINLSQVLSSLEILTASANANSAVNMTISGVENNGPLDPANVYIADGAITTSKLANSSVTSTKIAANAVTNTAILDDAVSTTKIANSAITTDKIAANAVVTADIANNAVTQAKLDTAVPLSGMRNKIINGDFRIAQRGSSVVTLGPGGVWPTDRFFAQSFGTITVTAQQAVDAPANTGLRNSVLFTTTSPNTDNNYQVNYTHRMEGYGLEELGLTNGVSGYLSFWVKSDVAGSYCIGLSTGYRGGATYNFGFLPVSYTINSTNTWEYKTIYIPPYVSGGAVWQYGTNLGLEITFNIAVGSSYPSVRTDTIGQWTTFSSLGYFSGRSGSNNVTWGKTNGHKFSITGIQFEAGPQPTPFEQRSFGVELALCQRYYEKSYLIGTAPGTNITTGIHGHGGGSNAGNHLVTTVFFSVPKRSAPNMTAYMANGTQGSWDYSRSGATSAAAITFDYASEHHVFTYLNVGAAWVPAYMYGHWVAEKEL